MLFNNCLYVLMELVFFCNFPTIQSQRGIGQSPSEEDNINRYEDGGGIWRISKGCRPISFCRGISWKPSTTDELMMEFRIFTSDRHKYMAMAISADTEMVYSPVSAFGIGDDDVYVCSQNGSGFIVSSGYLPEKSPPVLDKLEQPVDSFLLGEYASCGFTRPLVVSRTINGAVKTWHLGLNPFNILYAEGQLGTSGQILKHSFSTSTSQAFDLLRTSNYKPQPSQVPPKQPEEAKPPQWIISKQVNELDNIVAKPGLTKNGVWSVPNENCRNRICESVNWHVIESDEDGEWVQFIIIGENKGWIATAISRDTTMGKDDCYICSKSQSGSSSITFTSAFNTAAVAPTPVETDTNVVFQHGAVFDNVLACQFKRRLSITKTVNGESTTWDLRNETFHLLFAEGEISGQGQFLPHDFARYTHGPFYFLSNSGYKKDDTKISKPQIPLSKLHTLDLSQVIYEQGGYIWIFPNKCEENCRKLQWKPIHHKGQLAMKFTLNVPAVGYSGFMITENLNSISGQHESQLVDFGECYFCYLKDPTTTDVTIGRKNCSFSDIPVSLEELGSNWSPNSTVNDNMLTCSFVRPLSLNISHGSKILNHDLSAKHYYILYGEGAVSKDGIMQTVKTTSALSEPLLNVNITNQEYLKSTDNTKLDEKATGYVTEILSTTKETNKLTDNITIVSTENTSDNLLNSTDFVVSSLSSTSANGTSDSAKPPQIQQALLLFQLCTILIVYIV